MARIGLLHPGQMGFAVGDTLRNSGHEVLWASEGRSARTSKRAENFSDVHTLTAVANSAEAIVSVCPPEFAKAVAESTAHSGFKGIYADVNAVSPQSKQEMAAIIEAPGASFVDGGIIGLPPRERNKTWLYLSGPQAMKVAAYFTAGPLEVEVLGEQPGKASALKMCYAGWNKGSTALVTAMLAAASEMGVLEELKCVWQRGGPVYKDIETHILRAAPKAWRWAPEMREIAATLEASGLPAGFHQAAEELYASLKDLKDSDSAEITQVLSKVRK